MHLSLPARLFACGALVATACVGALALDSPLLAALLGLVAGAAAMLVAGPSLFPAAPAIEPLATRPERENQAREMIDALTDPMMLLGEGRVVAANEAAKSLLGEWIEGQDVRLALRHPQVVEHLIRPASKPRAPEQFEIEGIAQPDRRWLVTIAPLRDGSQMVHLSDRSEAIAAEKMRVDFVANASHELRTPLATMLGFIETLEDDRAAADRTTRLRFLEIMDGEGKRMQQLIEDLMSLSRIEADRFRPPSDPVALASLIEEVRNGCAQLLAERKSRLEVEADGVAGIVPGDRGQLLQLIRNLVANALKYGREGESVRVRIEDAGSDMVRLSVIDRGDGIAPEHLPRLTERFYRVDPGRSRAVGGTGLGLAIVKHIVGRHRGRMEIRSRVGEGTVVEILLPRAQETLSQNRNQTVTGVGPQ
jgi:two-component system phosphate regulon sensor histidine kinase PhoR